MLIFDTKIDRLPEVSKMNTGKMIEKIKNTGGSAYMGGLYGNIDFSGLQGFQHNSPNKKQEEDDPRWSSFKNWTDNTSNYFIVKTNYTTVTEGAPQANEEKAYEMFG